MKIMTVFGTRPEAIKMCPVVQELKKRDGAEVVVCVTGQHREMLQQVLDVFNVVPEYDLKIMKRAQTLYDITDRVLKMIRPVLMTEHPDAVLVHGDTTTAFAAALACYYEKIPVGHVEAGLRTNDLYAPFPEEFNRQAVDIIARWKFAPTTGAWMNLLKEGKDIGTYVTGNTVIDAMRTTINRGYRHPYLSWAQNSRLVLLTAHRRENQGGKLIGTFRAIRRVVDEHPDVKVIYPIHMNPYVKNVTEIIGIHERIRIVNPLNVVTWHNLMDRSFMILTDSGGIQEEATSLGKPTLVLREKTERPEGVKTGTLKLVGTDEKQVYTEFTRLLDDREAYRNMHRSANPYGDGHASERIADILLKQ